MAPNLLLVKFLALFYAFFQVPGQTPVGIFSNGVPLPPLSGMLVWWEADYGSNCGGVACTDGASQDSWTDRSGNLNTGVGNGTRRLGSAVPLCIASVYHTNQINGRPAVTFNGNNTTPSCFAYAAGGTGVNLTTASTTFVVEKLAAATNGISIMGGDGNALNWQINGLAGFAINFANKSCGTSLGNGTKLSDLNWHQMNMTYNNTAAAWRVDRATDTNTSPAAATITVVQSGMGGNGCGGTQQAFNGQVAAWLIYNRVLSGGEITTVETYLNSKYGL